MNLTHLKSLHNTLLVKNFQYGERKLTSGLIVADDDMQAHGIHPRWGEVFAVGKKITDIKVGDFILISHGRWTRGFKVTVNKETFLARHIDTSAVLCVTKTPPIEYTLSDKI